MENEALDRRTCEILECLAVARPRLMGLFYAHRVTQEDAEDILQDAVVVLVQRWGEIGDPIPYLLGVVRYRILHRARRRLIRREVPLDPVAAERIPDGDPPQERADLRHDLGVVLSGIPGRGGELLSLHYCHGMTDREIAAHLPCARASVHRLLRRHLERARRRAEEVGLRR